MPQKKKRKQFNYLPMLAASAPAFAAKAVVGDLPKGAIEHAVEKKLISPKSSLTGNFVHGLKGRGAGRAMGAGMGVLTAPVFLRGIQLAGSDSKSDQKKGLALIAGTGATFAFQKALLEKIQSSRAAGKGVPEVMAEAAKLLESLVTEKEVVEVPRKVFHPRPRGGSRGIYREGNIFVVDIPDFERLMTKDGRVSTELRWQLKQYFTRMGISKSLKKAGIKTGDRVRCGKLEWEWR